MNKQDFFTIIKEGLNDFPEEELNDILQEYETYFKEGISQGKTEEEIINNLDNPFMIINKYRNNYLPKEDKISSPNIEPNTNYNNSYTENDFTKSTYNNKSTSTKSSNNNNLILKILIVALILVLFGPFLIAAFGIVIGLLISLIAIPFGLLVGGSAFLVGRLGVNFIGFTVPNFLTDFPMDVAALITLGSFFATTLFIILTFYFIKFIVICIKKLLSSNSNKEI